MDRITLYKAATIRYHTLTSIFIEEVTPHIYEVYSVNSSGGRFGMGVFDTIAEALIYIISEYSDESWELSLNNPFILSFIKGDYARKENHGE